MIIKENIDNWNEWIWAEVSGRIEELYKKHGGFQVPDKYLDIYLVQSYKLDGDGFHYYHPFKDDVSLSKKEEELRHKTIFGIKGQSAYEILLEDAYGPLLDFIKRVESGNLNESVYDRYFAKLSPIEQSKLIVDRIVSVVFDDGIYELPPEIYYELQTQIEALKMYLKQGLCEKERIIHIKDCIENGEKVLSLVTILTPIAI